jgi:hypothetical protein
MQFEKYLIFFLSFGWRQCVKVGYIANISKKISAPIFKVEAIGVTLFR